MMEENKNFEMVLLIVIAQVWCVFVCRKSLK